jgi:hypothetical protein
MAVRARAGHGQADGAGRHGMREVASLRLSMNIDWSTGEPTPM